MTSNKIPASDTEAPGKENEKNLLQFLNKEILDSDPMQERKTQNDDLDSVVSDLLKQAIEESDKRGEDLESKSEGKTEASAHTKDSGEQINPIDQISTTEIEIEFGTTAESKGAFDSKNGIHKPKEDSEPVKADLSAHEIPEDTMSAPDIEEKNPGSKPTESGPKASSLFSDMEPVKKVGGMYLGKIPLNKYVLMGLVATIGIALVLTLYFTGGNTVVDEAPVFSEPVVETQGNAVEQSGIPDQSLNTIKINALPDTAVATADGIADKTAVGSQTANPIAGSTVTSSQKAPEKVAAPVKPATENAKSIQSEKPVVQKKDSGATAASKKNAANGKEPIVKPVKSQPAKSETVQTNTALVPAKPEPSKTAAVESTPVSVAKSPKTEGANPESSKAEIPKPDVQTAAKKSDGKAASPETQSNIDIAGTSNPLDKVPANTDSKADAALPPAANVLSSGAAIISKPVVVKNETNPESVVKSSSSGKDVSEVGKPQKPETIVRVEYKPPVVVYQEKPSFPRIATQRRETGKVILKININDAGKVVQAQPLSGPEVFYEEAVRSVLQWEFKPATRNGKNTPSQIKATINFNRK